MTMTLSKHAAAYYWQLCKVHGVRRVVMFLARVMRQANDSGLLRQAKTENISKGASK